MRLLIRWAIQKLEKQEHIHIHEPGYTCSSRYLSCIFFTITTFGGASNKWHSLRAKSGLSTLHSQNNLWGAGTLHGRSEASGVNCLPHGHTATQQKQPIKAFTLTSNPEPNVPIFSQNMKHFFLMLEMKCADGKKKKKSTRKICKTNICLFKFWIGNIFPYLKRQHCFLNGNHGY